MTHLYFKRVCIYSYSWTALPWRRGSASPRAYGQACNSRTSKGLWQRQCCGTSEASSEKRQWSPPHLPDASTGISSHRFGSFIDLRPRCCERNSNCVGRPLSRYQSTIPAASDGQHHPPATWTSRLAQEAQASLWLTAAPANIRLRLHQNLPMGLTRVLNSQIMRRLKWLGYFCIMVKN